MLKKRAHCNPFVLKKGHSYGETEFNTRNLTLQPNLLTFIAKVKGILIRNHKKEKLKIRYYTIIMRHSQKNILLRVI